MKQEAVTALLQEILKTKPEDWFIVDETKCTPVEWKDPNWKVVVGVPKICLKK